jgi:hypothetical protein
MTRDVTRGRRGRISTTLHVLRQAGILDRIAGMIVGPVDLIEVTEGGGELLEAAVG